MTTAMSSSLPDKAIAIFRSSAWPNAYIRTDGSNITSFQPSGGGTVNCQYISQQSIKDKQVTPWEKLRIHVDSATGLVALESFAFPNRYLRLNGTGVSAGNPAGPVVNLQFWNTVPTGDGIWELFKFGSIGAGAFTFESNAFPGVYLKIDGTGVNAFMTSGGGTVSGFYGVISDTTLNGYFV